MICTVLACVVCRAVLPPKHEWVIKCRLSPIQSQLYKFFLRCVGSGWCRSLASCRYDCIFMLSAVNLSAGYRSVPKAWDVSRFHCPFFCVP